MDLKFSCGNKRLLGGEKKTPKVLTGVRVPLKTQDFGLLLVLLRNKNKFVYSAMSLLFPLAQLANSP